MLVAIGLVLLPMSSQATPVLSVTPSVFPPNTASQAQICLVASVNSIVTNSNDVFVADFDSHITDVTSDDTPYFFLGATGFTILHESSIGYIRFLSHGAFMPDGSAVCVLVTITTGPAGPSLVSFATNNTNNIPVPSAQPIAIMALPVGPQGPPGVNGTNGIDGAPGAPGQSVLGTIEPAGPNCTAGGVRYEAATGTNYVCNGLDGATGPTGPQGPAGPAGAQGPEGPQGPQGEPAPKGGGCSVGDPPGALLILVVVTIVSCLRRGQSTRLDL